MTIDSTQKTVSIDYTQLDSGSGRIQYIDESFFSGQAGEVWVLQEMVIHVENPDNTDSTPLDYLDGYVGIYPNTATVPASAGDSSPSGSSNENIYTFQDYMPYTWDYNGSSSTFVDSYTQEDGNNHPHRTDTVQRRVSGNETVAIFIDGDSAISAGTAHVTLTFDRIL